MSLVKIEWTELFCFVIQNLPKEEDRVNLICYQHKLSFFLHFLPEFPKKLVENDGRKLARHIKNRGRPTEQTWQKYRESKRRREVLAGNLKLNIKLGVFFLSLNVWRVCTKNAV